MKSSLRSRRVLPLLMAGLLTASVSIAAVACGGTADTTGTTGGTGTTQGGNVSKVDDIQIAMADLTRLPASAPDADVTAAAASMDQFGADLYKLLAQEAGDGNVVFSPASIVAALAMTYAGANGATAEEMAATLHFSLTGDALHKAFNSLDSALESRSWQQKNSEGKDEGVLLKTANSLWAQKDLTFEQAFLDILAADYGAGVRLVDYQTAAEAARQAINRWVSDQTNAKIPELIGQGVLDALTRLVLVNAVYLDATWANQFDPQATADGDFTTLADNKVTSKMMSQAEVMPYAAGDGWKAVELPYLRDELALLIVVPDSGKFAQVEDQLGSGLIDSVVGRLGSDQEVALTLPKFKFRTQAGLNQAWGALGMKAAFDPNSADFSAMTKQASLYISDVIHEAYIAVDEEGTEAAAATAVVMRLTAALPTEQVQLTIDRPFLFAIRDRATGAILFLGRVTDPTK
jgi:serpin B